VHTNSGNSYSLLFLILVTFFVVFLILANLIASKLILVFGMTLPAAVIIFPITYILGDLFTEVYGFRQTRKIIWLGLTLSLLAVCVYQITIILPYPDYWANQDSYKVVFATTPRILAASALAYFFGEFLNSAVLSKMKVVTNGRFLGLRTIGSSILGLALDTFIFIFIAFYGQLPGQALWQMMLFQYIWKLSYEIILTPFVYILTNKVKKIEKIDTFDINVTYNPFNVN
jgi:uncharacterized integral membrane protein (TIGR00697 family)